MAWTASRRGGGAVGVLGDGGLAVGVGSDVDRGPDLVAQQRARGAAGVGELEGGASGVDAERDWGGELGADQDFDGVCKVEVG